MQTSTPCRRVKACDLVPCVSENAQPNVQPAAQHLCHPQHLPSGNRKRQRTSGPVARVPVRSTRELEVNAGAKAQPKTLIKTGDKAAARPDSPWASSSIWITSSRLGASTMPYGPSCGFFRQASARMDMEQEVLCARIIKLRELLDIGPREIQRC